MLCRAIAARMSVMFMAPIKEGWIHKRKKGPKTVDKLDVLENVDTGRSGRSVKACFHEAVATTPS